MRNENELIRSVNYNIKRVCQVVIIIATVISVINIIGGLYSNYQVAQSEYNAVLEEIEKEEEEEDSYYYVIIDCKCDLSSKTTMNQFIAVHPDAISYMQCHSDYWSLFDEYDFMNALFPHIITIVAVLIYKWLSAYSLTVTDKRVYGKTSFGKRVDLPFDSISSVGTSFMKGLSVGTSSGKICFKLIKNQKDIYDIINENLFERQQKNNARKILLKQNTTVAEEIKSFKELLDMGAITQEEFDAKKKELLGL